MSAKTARPGGTSGRRALPAEVADLLQRNLLPPVGAMVRLHGARRRVYGQLLSYGVVDDRIHVLIARAEQDEDGEVHAVRRLVRLEAIDVCSWDVEPNRADRALASSFPTRRRQASSGADQRSDPDEDLTDGPGEQLDSAPVTIPLGAPSGEQLADAGQVPIQVLIAVALLAVYLLIAGVGAGVDGRVIVAGVLAWAVWRPLQRRFPRYLSYQEGPW